MNILEPTNATWFVLGCYLLVMLGRYMLMTIRDLGWSDEQMSLPKALFLTFFGITGTRGILALSMQGYPWDVLTIPMGVFFILSVFGMLCVIRVLSPNSWGVVGFVAPLLLAGGTFSFVLML